MDIEELARMLEHMGLEPWPDGRSILDEKRPVEQHIMMVVSSLQAQRDNLKLQISDLKKLLNEMADKRDTERYEFQKVFAKLTEQDRLNDDLKAELRRCGETISLEFKKRQEVERLYGLLLEVIKAIALRRCCDDVCHEPCSSDVAALALKEVQQKEKWNQETPFTEEQLKVLRDSPFKGTATQKRKDEGRVVCWFAEVNRESKAACSVCKDVHWPRWYGADDNLTDDPHHAKRFACREDCLKFCTSGRPRHWHLYPTEHVFMA